MYLERIKAPSDLKQIPVERLPEVAAEIRQKIIDVVSRSGGHIASSLGAVELTLALHYCFDAPRDKIVFDVGHQCYAHKILTGRNEDFVCLRQYDGITGFPCKDESEYDPFTTGHSSTAVSLALGLACARDLSPEGPERQRRIAAVIGDGSLSGGLCFEGLNNAGHLKKDLLVVLNTNEMSIAPNVGAVSTYLNKLISMPVYNRFKTSFDKFVESRIPRGRRLVKLANKFEEGLKGLFIPGMFFEELGFRYFGPINGNNLAVLIPTLKNILSIKGPLLLHVVTKKGKGYPPAENDPVKFHSAAPFDIATGESAPAGGAPSYTAVFSKALVAAGEANDKVVAIYSTFLQRAYDQIVECVALQNVPVVFCLDRAGVVPDDGATHQGVFDIAYLRNIPNMVVMAPRDGEELSAMLQFAVRLDMPSALRYPKARTPAALKPVPAIELGKAEVLCEGDDFALIAFGSMVVPAYEAAQSLAAEGMRGTVVNARFAKPLDHACLLRVAARTKHVFTVEDGSLDAGFGSAVMEVLGMPVVRLGIPDEFIPCGKRDQLLRGFGLTAQGIANVVKKHRRARG